MDNMNTVKELLKVKSKRKRFSVGGSLAHLDKLLGGELPGEDECWKLISEHHFSAMSLILYIAERTPIRSLYVSTFNIGRKEIVMLDGLHRSGKIGNAALVMGRIVENAPSADARTRRELLHKVCADNGWRHVCTDNHAKLVLAETGDGLFVVESSSNLGECPSIEFFSFERSAELYGFYRDWFELLLERK